MVEGDSEATLKAVDALGRCRRWSACRYFWRTEEAGRQAVRQAVRQARTPSSVLECPCKSRRLESRGREVGGSVSALPNPPATYADPVRPPACLFLACRAALS